MRRVPPLGGTRFFLCYIANNMAKLSETLKSRGYVYQFSAETLEEITDGPKRTIYLGVDPTADSIHVGHLATYMLLRRFSDAGHKVILLIGGGTGMIGDPKPDVERPLLSLEEIEMRTGKLQKQTEKLLGGIEIQKVNNADWLTKLNLLEFLRNIGKHFTVNSLVKKDAISARMESDDGISYTEFSYPLLQAYDFLHLNREHGCDVQVGGSDQWGNIIAGVDLIRRKENKTAYALTIPLVVDKASGKKFGKSEGNAVWLDAEKTSPYQFYQFWLNSSDESVEDYLKLFTLLEDNEILETMKEQQLYPGTRVAQRRLAYTVTSLVHGDGDANSAQAISEVLFGTGELSSIDANQLKNTAPMCAVAAGISIVDALVQSGLASSKREARQFVEDGAVTLNNMKVGERVLDVTDFRDSVALLKRGKRNVCVLTLSSEQN
jgi:tyrosyl-tRNA synthetase